MKHILLINIRLLDECHLIKMVVVLGDNGYVCTCWMIDCLMRSVKQARDRGRAASATDQQIGRQSERVRSPYHGLCLIHNTLSNLRLCHCSRYWLTYRYATLSPIVFTLY